MSHKVSLIFVVRKKRSHLNLLWVGFAFLQKKGFSVVLSDMCPLVSGISSRDAALSFELGMRALDLAVGKAANLRDDNFQTEGESCTSVLNDDGAKILDNNFQSEGETHTSDPDDGVLQPRGHLVIKLLESEDIRGGNLLHTTIILFCY